MSEPCRGRIITPDAKLFEETDPVRKAFKAQEKLEKIKRLLDEIPIPRRTKEHMAYYHYSDTRDWFDRLKDVLK